MNHMTVSIHQQVGGYDLNMLLMNTIICTYKHIHVHVYIHVQLTVVIPTIRYNLCTVFVCKEMYITRTRTKGISHKLSKTNVGVL